MPGPADVELTEITAQSVRGVCRLAVATEQRELVAENAVSIAEAYFEPAAWFRAITAAGESVGFVMLYDPTRTATPEDGPHVAYLWRFMIDHRHQRRGYGEAALRRVVAHARTLPGVRTLKTSYVPLPGNAWLLYQRIGFRATGVVDEGEHVLELDLSVER